MLPGISVHGYKEIRMRRENLIASQLESSAHYRHVVYWGRQFLTDVDTNVTAKGPLKVGSSVSATSTMRQRNEGGGDFRLYAEMVFDAVYYQPAEKAVHDFLNEYSINGLQGQKEIFKLPDSHLFQKVGEAIKYLGSKFISPREVLLFGPNSWCNYDPLFLEWFSPTGQHLCFTPSFVCNLPTPKGYATVNPEEHGILQW